VYFQWNNVSDVSFQSSRADMVLTPFPQPDFGYSERKGLFMLHTNSDADKESSL